MDESRRGSGGEGDLGQGALGGPCSAAWADSLGSYVLDAIPALERLDVEVHVAGCSRCQSELQRYRETLAVLAPLHDAPPQLWESIQAAIAPSPQPTISRPAGSSGRIWQYVAGVVTAGAVAAVSVLGVNLASADQRLATQPRPANSLTAAFSSAEHSPGVAQALLRPLGQQRGSADAVVLPDGQGFLTSSLPSLPKGEVYQLWGVSGSSILSLAVLGNDPRTAAFSASTGTGVNELMITAEKAPGVAVTSHVPVVAGPLQS